MIFSSLLILWLAVPGNVQSTTPVGNEANVPKATPIMRTVEPALVKAGMAVTIKGENLSKESVSAVYLNDGKKQREITLSSQTRDSVSFTIPADCKPASYRVVVLVNSLDPTLIEEPVRVNVVDKLPEPLPEENPAPAPDPAPAPPTAK